MKIFSSDRIPAADLFLLAVLLCQPCGPAFAAQETLPASADAKKAQKIHITAQRLISDSANNSAEFIGQVKANQGDTQILADSLKVYFKGGSGNQAAPASQSLEKLVATGNVQIKFDNRLAVARQAVYITAHRVLTLIGPEATITSGENTISGEKITFYRDDGRFTVEGGSNGRVKAIILPEDSGLE